MKGLKVGYLDFPLIAEGLELGFTFDGSDAPSGTPVITLLEVLRFTLQKRYVPNKEAALKPNKEAAIMPAGTAANLTSAAGGKLSAKGVAKPEQSRFNAAVAQSLAQLKGVRFQEEVLRRQVVPGRAPESLYTPNEVEDEEHMRKPCSICKYDLPPPADMDPSQLDL